jgi:hypothetical protein
MSAPHTLSALYAAAQRRVVHAVHARSGCGYAALKRAYVAAVEEGGADAIARITDALLAIHGAPQRQLRRLVMHGATRLEDLPAPDAEARIEVPRRGRAAAKNADKPQVTPSNFIESTTSP